MESSIWAAQVAAYQAEVSLYALKVETAKLMGYQKLRYGDPVLEGPGQPIRIAPAKCPYCGSREFRAHNNVMTCTYCRSPAEGSAPQASRIDTMTADDFIHYSGEI